MMRYLQSNQMNMLIIIIDFHNWQQLLRQGTHSVKNRSAVRGGGRKPWRQKGTGRARQGSIPLSSMGWWWTSIWPNLPRSYAYKLPRKVRRLALRSALSDKVANENLK